MSEPVLKALAGRVTRERERRGWSMREMARRSAMSASTASRIERGDHDCWLTMIARVADAFDITLSDLLAAPDCATCADTPPRGFICIDCGRRSDG